MIKRILVVDDDAAMLSAIRRDLRGLPDDTFEIHYASDGREALKLFKSTDFTLLITDIFMPEIEGLGLISTVRDKYPATRIIAMSGGGSLGDLQYLEFAKKMGNALTLAKPFTREELLAAIAQALA